MTDVQQTSGIEQVGQVMRRGWKGQLRELASHSTALRLAALGWRALAWDPEEHRYRWIQRAMAAWEDSARLSALARTLSEIQGLAAASGAATLAVVFPERSQLEDFAAFGEPYRKAMALLADLGIPAVSGREALGFDGRSAKAERLDAVFLAGDHIHFTPEGHARLAEALVEPVRKALSAASRAPGGVADSPRPDER